MAIHAANERNSQEHLSVFSFRLNTTFPSVIPQISWFWDPHHILIIAQLWQSELGTVSQPPWNHLRRCVSSGFPCQLAIYRAGKRRWHWQRYFMVPCFSFSLPHVHCKRAISRIELWIRAKTSYTTHVYRYIWSDWLIKKTTVQAQFTSSHIGKYIVFFSTCPVLE